LSNFRAWETIVRGAGPHARRGRKTTVASAMCTRYRNENGLLGPPKKVQQRGEQEDVERQEQTDGALARGVTPRVSSASGTSGSAMPIARSTTRMVTIYPATAPQRSLISQPRLMRAISVEVTG